MNITVRLYRLHDYDLIYLYKNLKYPVRDVMKKALTAYVRNEVVFFDFPVSLPETDEIRNVKNSQFHLKLDEYDDADIIDFLAKLKEGYRNSFLKNLLRYYLSGPPVYVYMRKPELTEAQFRIDSMRLNIDGTKEIPLMKRRKRKSE